MIKKQMSQLEKSNEERNIDSFHSVIDVLLIYL